MPIGEGDFLGLLGNGSNSSRAMVPVRKEGLQGDFLNILGPGNGQIARLKAAPNPNN